MGRGRAKSGGVRSAEALAKEGRMERRSAPVAGVRRVRLWQEKGRAGPLRWAGGRPGHAAGAQEAEAPAPGGGGEAEGPSSGGSVGSLLHRRGGRVRTGHAGGTQRRGPDPTGWVGEGRVWPGAGLVGPPAGAAAAAAAAQARFPPPPGWRSEWRLQPGSAPASPPPPRPLLRNPPAPLPPRRDELPER